MHLSRRNFLKSSSTLIGGFALNSFSSPLISVLGPGSENDNVLVLIQLNGGNDGLNTLIPLSDYSAYHKVRSNIAIPENQLLKLNGYANAGFHPALTGFQQLYNEGQMRIIQSVGYPEPVFSHFRAADIWASGSASDTVLNSGWAGRYLSYEYPGAPENYPNSDMTDPLAIQIGNTGSLLFQGDHGNLGMSIHNTNSFYNTVSGITDPVPDTYWGEQLTYIRQVAEQTSSYSGVIRDAADKVDLQGEYPDTHLANQLKIVACLVKGGLKTKIYMVSTYGFDTHANQSETHARILKEVSDAVLAFMNDAKGLGIDKRITGMTYSEFGRRIHSNASGGTDHGAAAPLFIFGNSLVPGILGQDPEIPETLNGDDNIPFQYDFRSVYASLLRDWFCTPVNAMNGIFSEDLQHLPIIQNSACGTALPINDRGNPRSRPEDQFKIYPNPFTDSMSIQFRSRGSRTTVQLINGAGKVVGIITNGKRSAGMHDIVFDAGHLPAGTYYVRYQDEYRSFIKTVLKVR